MLTATASSTTPEGSYTFNVASLVSNYQAVSTGVADASRTPIGRGTVTIESGQARVNPPTYLDVLNNGDGVQRGTIRVTDRAGRTTDIDLSTALTVDDVLKTINSTYSVGVHAAIQGNRSSSPIRPAGPAR